MSGGFDGMAIDDAQRRAAVRAHPQLNGLDYLEVGTDTDPGNQRLLRLYVLAPDPPEDPVLQAKVAALLDDLADPANRTLLEITGGVRTRGLGITHAERVEDHLLLHVDRAGDFSDYTLHAGHPSLDPCFREIGFSFKAGCPARFDCAAVPQAPEPAAPGPHIDYLAKDYAGLRQALIDFLPTRVPGWTERREADFAMELLELFAYVGDRLSYAQDAVANEAYLETARQRISVRRHTRLIDYRMHDGLSALALLHCTVAADLRLDPDPDGVLLRALTAPRQPAGAGPAIPPGQAGQALDSSDAVFEVLAAGHPGTGLLPAGPVLLWAAHNKIQLHDWGTRNAVLPAGATSAVLAQALPQLAPGDLLLFEELRSPLTPQGAGRDPAHRQVVRLTRVGEPTADPLTGQPLTRVQWGAEDALRFDLCIAGQDPNGAQLPEPASVARGNLLPAFHGRTLRQTHTVGGGRPGAPADPRGYRFRLDGRPLGFLPAAELSAQPAAAMEAVEPRGALPAVLRLTATAAGDTGREWSVAARGDLLGSGRFEEHFVVESDNDGAAQLRFGDNRFGMAPAGGSRLEVRYRVGLGAAGNVGAEALAHFIQDPARPATLDIVAVRNPLPAWGGTEPEPIEAAKAVAPAAVHSRTFRAVTEQDYARAAMEHPAVRDAAARFRWTGSWHTVFLYVDPLDAAELSPALAREVAEWVGTYALAGYDLEVLGPVYVPLMVDVALCPEPGRLARDVERAVLDALGTGPGGFFHPDRFGFGQPLYLSALLAAVEAVPGVGSARLDAFARRYDPDPAATATNLARGSIPAAALEVLRLDNDPSFPENGLLGVRSGG